jgi:hypothetical protein
MFDSVYHNECDQFSIQIWTWFKKGGWIDRQKDDMDASSKKKAAAKSE